MSRAQNGELLYAVNEKAEMCGQISVSLMCNLRHSFCFQQSFSKQRLDGDVLYNRLKPMYRRVHRLRILGGEPTVVPGIRDYVAWLLETFPHLELEIVTNGVNFDRAWRILAREKGFRVQVSVNGFSDEVFARVSLLGDPARIRRRIYSNLADLIEEHRKHERPLINCISMVLNEDTAVDLEPLVLYALKHGLNVALQLPAQSGESQFDSVKAKLAEDALRLSCFCRDYVEIDVRLVTDEHRQRVKESERDLCAEKEAFLERARRNGGIEKARSPIGDYLYAPPDDSDGHCRMPMLGFSIMPSGDVLPCCHLSGYPVGNIHRDSAEELLDNARRRQLQKLLLANDYRLCWRRCKFNRNPESSL